jgi:hypothetical protein
MLELRTSNVPGECREILPFLLTPAGWQQKGSIPAFDSLFVLRNTARGIDQTVYLNPCCRTAEVNIV